jgi:hypothetical protein
MKERELDHSGINVVFKLPYHSTGQVKICYIVESQVFNFAIGVTVSFLLPHLTSV